MRITVFITSLNATRDKQGYVTHLDVAGRGFGHGVGLCQYGAVGLAKKGQGFQTILESYYPGTRLDRLEEKPSESAR